MAVTRFFFLVKEENEDVRVLLKWEVLIFLLEMTLVSSELQYY